MPQFAPTWDWLSDIVALGARAYAGSSIATSTLLPSGYVSHSFQGGHIREALDFNYNGYDFRIHVDMDVLTGPDGEIVFAIRGTDELPAEAAFDNAYRLELGSLGYSPALQAYARLLLPAISAVLSTAPSDARIVFAGHSLGGIVAEQLVQWHYDPTDAGDISFGSRDVYGVGFGSPPPFEASPTLDDAPFGRFVHIARRFDAVGLFEAEGHIGNTIQINDHQFGPSQPLSAHNHDLYASQMARLAGSPLAAVATVGENLTLEILSTTTDYASGYGLIGAGHYAPVQAEPYRLYFGTELADRIVGGATPLYADMGGGADHLTGGGSNDLLAGGSGNDTYHVGVGQGYDIIEDGGGAMDTLALYTGLVASAFDYNWFSREGDDLLVRIPDGAGGWHINVRIKDIATTAGGIERVELWAGAGTALTNTWDLAALWAGLSGPEAPSPPPTSQPPGVAPETRDDVIVLGAGNDEARISGGRDQVDGGDGIDRLVVDYRDATLNVRADLNDAYVGSFGGSRSVWIQRFEALTVFGGSGADEMTGGNYEDFFYGGGGNDDLEGDDGDDTLDGGDGNDLLTGGTGEDVLTGSAGDDTLYAKGWQNGGLLFTDLSADWLDGGAGIDRAGVDLWGETRDVAFLGSQAATATGFTFVNGTHLRNAEQFVIRTGNGADRVWDGALDDEFDLGSGDDLAHVSRGRDQVHGGDGIDRLVVDYRDATLNVRADLNDAYVGSINSDRSVWIQWFEALTVFGGSGADEMTGGNYEDFFYGGGGNDDLEGDDGDDTLDGGDGNDLLTGGTGEDVLTGSAGDDTLYAKGWQNGGLLFTDLSADWLDGGAGIDRAGVDLWGETRDVAFLGSQAATATGFTFVNGTHLRNAEQFVIRTGNGADRVWDGALDDEFDLGSGDDLAHVSGGRDRVDGGDGVDRLVIDYRDATLDVYASLNNAGAGSFGGPRSVWIQWIESLTVFGGSGADEMDGGSYQDLFYGGGGNDDLDGWHGDDTLDGGAGDDTLTGGLGDDLIDGGSGHDILIVSGAASGYRLLMDGDNFILKGPDGGDRLTGVESIRFSDGRMLELNRMYGPDVDTRAWADGRIPEALLSGGVGSGERPLVLPGPAGDDLLIGKDGGGPEVLPGADDGDGWVWKDDDVPLVLPGAEDVFVVGAEGFDGPEVLPGIDDWTPAGAKGFDQPEVLPGLDERTLFTFDRAALLDPWSGQMLTVDEQGLVVDHYARGGGWSPDGWSF